MAEKVLNNFSTTVAVGGYTAGSGVLNVTATAGTVNGQIFTLGIYNQTTGAVITLFRVATVASGTQFTGAAEGTDTNASAGDIVVAIMSEAAFNGVCSDAYLNTSNITTNDVSITKHGFAPKSPNDATKYLDGTGAYTVPAGGSALPGGSNTQLQYNNAGAFGGITGATTNGTAVTLTAPVLGTPASGTLTNCTGTASGLTSGITLALKSATTTVDVSAATAPTSGQVLTATSGTAATWQTSSGGSDVIGTASFSGGTGAITNLVVKGVISNITRTSAGLYNVVFGTNQSNYVASILCNSNLTNAFGAYMNTNDTSPPATGFQFATVNLSTVAAIDCFLVMVTICKIP